MTAAYWWWTVAYLMVPVLVVALAQIVAYFRKVSSSNPFKDESLLFVVGAVLGAIVFWPAIPIFWMGESLFDMAKRLACQSPQGVQCQRNHLQGNSTISNAEAAAKVMDPLHRVPDVPFGHLNRGWQDFLAKRKRGYRLKRFEIPGSAAETRRETGPRWSIPRGRKLGYAWVGLTRVKAEFIYEWD